MSKQEIRLILTSVGGLIVPNIIKSLKQNSINKFYIVGTDVQQDAIGFHFVDKSYMVPHGNSDEYSNQLLDIAIRENIDLIIPFSDEELLNLAKNKTVFEKHEVSISSSGYDKVRVSSNKALLMQFLESHRIPVPEYKIPHSIEELRKGAESLGYPEKPVVFKPQNAHGARGFWLIQEDFDKQEMILQDRIRQKITLDWLSEFLNDGKPFPSVLIMEFLTGKDYNVDALTDNGNSLYIIPIERIIPEAGPVQVGLIKRELKVEEMARAVIQAFGFSYWVNIEMAYDQESGQPLIYEINPRISAPIIASKAAGVDLMTLGIRFALGEKIEENLSIKETKMIRYWDEYFITEGL